MKLKLKRRVTKVECPWLEKDLDQGTVVYKAVGCAYGCITPYGVAVTFDEKGDYPFFEVPTNSVEK